MNYTHESLTLGRIPPSILYDIHGSPWLRAAFCLGDESRADVLAPTNLVPEFSRLDFALNRIQTVHPAIAGYLHPPAGTTPKPPALAPEFSPLRVVAANKAAFAVTQALESETTLPISAGTKFVYQDVLVGPKLVDVTDTLAKLTISEPPPVPKPISPILAAIEGRDMSVKLTDGYRNLIGEFGRAMLALFLDPMEIKIAFGFRARHFETDGVKAIAWTDPVRQSLPIKTWQGELFDNQAGHLAAPIYGSGFDNPTLVGRFLYQVHRASQAESSPNAWRFERPTAESIHLTVDGQPTVLPFDEAITPARLYVHLDAGTRRRVVSGCAAVTAAGHEVKDALLTDVLARGGFANREELQAVDHQIGAAMATWPHALLRTYVNGFNRSVLKP